MSDRTRVDPTALVAAVATCPRATLPAVLAAVAARMASEPGAAEPNSQGELLTAEQAGRRLGLTARQVYRRADRWPFTRRLGPKTLRFDAAGLELYLGRSR